MSRNLALPKNKGGNVLEVINKFFSDKPETLLIVRNWVMIWRFFHLQFPQLFA